MVELLGMIKYLVVNLAQILVKSIVMDIVVVDIPTIIGIFLSSSRGMKLGGPIKIDLAYATIPVFGGEECRLYRESIFVTVTTVDNSNNSPVHGQEKYILCLLLEMDE